MTLKKSFKVGFIGSGMMGEAIIQGILNKKLISPTSILTFDPCENRVAVMNKLNVVTMDDTTKVGTSSDVIILAMKPDIIRSVVKEHGHAWGSKLVISTAAGVKLKDLEKYVPEKTSFIRVMPNTPALIGKSATCFSKGKYASLEDCKIVKSIFGSIGTVDEIPEEKMDAVTGLSGSGPAYIYILIEAMSDAGVKEGLSRDLALKLAAQTVSGASQMVLETGEHPAVLRNKVESPGGTTITATSSLEDSGFRSAIMNAVFSAAGKSRDLGKPISHDKDI